jgi:hypothetical protein
MVGDLTTGVYGFGFPVNYLEKHRILFALSFNFDTTLCRFVRYSTRAVEFHCLEFVMFFIVSANLLLHNVTRQTFSLLEVVAYTQPETGFDGSVRFILRKYSVCIRYE